MQNCNGGTKSKTIFCLASYTPLSPSPHESPSNHTQIQLLGLNLSSRVAETNNATIQYPPFSVIVRLPSDGLRRHQVVHNIDHVTAGRQEPVPGRRLRSGGHRLPAAGHRTARHTRQVLQEVSFQRMLTSYRVATPFSKKIH